MQPTPSEDAAAGDVVAAEDVAAVAGHEQAVADVAAGACRARPAACRVHPRRRTDLRWAEGTGHREAETWPGRAAVAASPIALAAVA